MEKEQPTLNFQRSYLFSWEKRLKKITAKNI